MAAQIRQSRPDSGLGVQMKVRLTSYVVLISLGSRSDKDDYFAEM